MYRNREWSQEQWTKHRIKHRARITRRNQLERKYPGLLFTSTELQANHNTTIGLLYLSVNYWNYLEGIPRVVKERS